MLTFRPRNTIVFAGFVFANVQKNRTRQKNSYSIAHIDIFSTTFCICHRSAWESRMRGMRFAQTKRSMSCGMCNMSPLKCHASHFVSTFFDHFSNPCLATHAICQYGYQPQAAASNTEIVSKKITPLSISKLNFEMS